MGSQIKYVIQLIDDKGGVLSTGYLGNETYYMNQERYASVVCRIEEAKRYNSYKNAENAYLKLKKTCSNLHKYKILEMEVKQ